MKKTYPLLKVDTYEMHTHEGVKRIESWQKEKEIELDIHEKAIEKNTDFQGIEDIYFEGVGSIMVQVGPQVFPQEIRFMIDAKTIDEAMNKFNESAAKYMKEMQEEQIEAQNQIVTPGDGGLFVP